MKRTDKKNKSKQMIYDSEYHPRQAYLLSLLFGARTADIARVLNVATRTLLDWKYKYSEFADALRRGSDECDAKVSEALLKVILGYEEIEEVVEVKHARVIRYKVVKKHPPNGFLALKWLAARQRDVWNPAADVNITHKRAPAVVDTSDISDDELKVLRKIGLERLSEHAQSN